MGDRVGGSNVGPGVSERTGPGVGEFVSSSDIVNVDGPGNLSAGTATGLSVDGGSVSPLPSWTEVGLFVVSCGIGVGLGH
jgi:hypothetical protein